MSSARSSVMDNNDTSKQWTVTRVGFYITKNYVKIYEVIDFA